ncbi:MAG: hypothetical protein ACLU84_07265 [Clostridia bacterium]
MKEKMEQKGITLIALMITIIILIILAGISLSMIVGESGLITKTKQAKENIQIAVNEEEEQIAKLTNELYSDEQAKIPKNVPNAPRLAEGMSPIKFKEPSNDEKGEVIPTTILDADWYHYEDKKWANAKTKDGSMWVWIPRYAYRVNNSNQTFDIVFLIGDSDYYYDKNGQMQTAKRCTSINQFVDTTTGYTVHPAFTDETKINYRNGGWDRELTGIWVTKFEAGYASRKQ